jgi:hypothetical protein
MRRIRAVPSLLAFAVIAAGSCACGALQAGAVSGTARAGAPASGSSFAAQARLVTRRWDSSAVARAWHTGLVLIDGEQLVQIPANAGFDSQRQKDMFSSGHFRLDAALPAGSPADVVRWASGATLRLPVEDARAAVTQLATPTPCGGPYPCSQLGDLTITSVRPVTVTMLTSRGPAAVPAWQFRVAQLSWSFTQLAVVPRALTLLPQGVGLGLTPALAGVSANGRTLTLRWAVGYCGGPLPVLAAQTFQSRTTVVVGVRVVTAAGATTSRSCLMIERLVLVSATLSRPLGARVVLDVGTGQPLTT